MFTLLLDYFTTSVENYLMNAQLKIMNLWPHKLKYLSITMNSQRKNFSSSTGLSIASLSLFAATSLLESLMAQLSMCCFIKFTACVITSFLSHQINLKAA